MVEKRLSNIYIESNTAHVILVTYENIINNNINKTNITFRLNAVDFNKKLFL